MGNSNNGTTIDQNILDMPLLSGSISGPLQNNTVSQLPVDLELPDLILPKSINENSSRLNMTDPTLLDGGSARTDVMGNILLSQRAKKRQQLHLAKKMAGISPGENFFVLVYLIVSDFLSNIYWYDFINQYGASD